MSSQSFDLAVVGGGIIGLAHAYAAAKVGKRVAVIERDARANGASIRNFGFITVSGQELMRHWDAVLPGRILRVHHEDVVSDLEGSVRRLLDYCGLEFQPACVDFHETRRSVRTPSSEQVRQPIFRDGLDQWTKFEPWLQPLKDALGDARLGFRA
jgi:2-polyprenyl-6-methoxyphenol hydroxylase-like FAD-dependent oxidoreductase